MKFLKKILSKVNYKHYGKKHRWLNKFVSRYPHGTHFNRQTIARGFSVGIFAGLLPLPLQMLIAIILALLVRGNIPIAIIATWISNPFTMIPIIYIIYKTGEFFTGEKSNHINFKALDFNYHHMTLFYEQLKLWISSLGKNFFIGLPIVAISAAVMGYFFILILWRISVIIQLKLRKKKIIR